MGTLRGDVRSVDITPYDFPGIRLGGFGFNRRATGVLHPLQAGVLYLVDGDEEVALVTVDSVGIPRPWVQRIRDAVTAMRPERVLVCATHSHATPDAMGYWGPSLLGVLPRRSGVEPGYMHQMVRQIAGAVDEAARAARPVQLRAARFEVAPDLFTNHRTKGLRDNAGIVLRVEDLAGKAVGTLVDFAAHPEGLWDKNRRISPDFPHHTRDVVQRAGGGTALYFSGALGGMLTPDIAKDAPTDVREAEIERIGTALGEAAATAATSAPLLPEAPLRVASRPLYLPFANWRFALAVKLNIFHRSLTDAEVRTEVNLVSLGGLRMATAPGECLPELGAEVKQAMGGELPLLFCLGCDELGYLLPHAQYDDPHWKYEVSMSVGRDAAPRIVAAIRELAAGL